MNLLDRKTKFCMAAMALTMLAVILLAGLVAPAQAQTYPIAFPAPATFTAAYCSSYPCDNSVTAAITGDFNGDGKLDVLTLDGSNLNVILGKGDGTFQTPISLNISATGIFSEAIAVGDFAGANVLDVAVWAVNANTGNSELHIFLGNGTGSLTYNATYAAPSSGNTNPGPNNLVAMDVNGDGKIDIVALTPYNGVFVFLGNGDGTFQAPIANTTVCTDSIGNCQSLAVGDLNGDGKPDLAVQSNDTIGGGISILLGNGNGTFGTPAYYPVAIDGVYAGAGIAIGDVNGDGKPDVVVGSGGGATAIVYLNKGGGTFKVNGTVGSVPLYATNNVVLADINNDKKLDIVVPDGFGDVYTFYGTGKALSPRGRCTRSKAATIAAIFSSLWAISMVMARSMCWILTASIPTPCPWDAEMEVFRRRSPSRSPSRASTKTSRSRISMATASRMWPRRD